MNRKRSYKELFLNIHPERQFQSLRVRGRYNIISYALLAARYTLTLVRYIRRLSTLADLRNNLKILKRIDFGCRKSESFPQKFYIILRFLFGRDAFLTERNLQMTSFECP